MRSCNGRMFMLRLLFRFFGIRMSEKETQHEHRSEEHTSELQSRVDLVCRLLLEKKNNGRVEETGGGAGLGSTINVPVPPGTTGDVYLAAIDEIVRPATERFGATSVLVSTCLAGH